MRIFLTDECRRTNEASTDDDSYFLCNNQKSFNCYVCSNDTPFGIEPMMSSKIR